MFTQRVRDVMERKKLLTAPPETTVSKATELMAHRKLGAEREGLRDGVPNRE